MADKPSVGVSGILGVGEHPADEHIEALQRAVKYMTALKNISPGYEERKQANQAQDISDAMPRGR